MFDRAEVPCDKLYLCKFVLYFVRWRFRARAITLLENAVVDRSNLQSVCCYLMMCFFAVKKGTDVDTSKVFLNRFHGEVNLDPAIIAYLIATGRSSVAIPIAEELVQSYPAIPEVWGWYARSLARTSQWSEIRNVIGKSLGLHPTSLPLRRHLIHALWSMPSSESLMTQLAWPILDSAPEDALVRGCCFATLMTSGNLYPARLFVGARFQMLVRGALSEELARRLRECAREQINLANVVGHGSS
jgi:hypothetical protein